MKDEPLKSPRSINELRKRKMSMPAEGANYDFSPSSSDDSRASKESRNQKPLKQALSPYKRPRNYNFTVQEKMHFLDCLQQYIEVTENRRLDTSSVVMKKKTWELLVARYNKRFPEGPPRNYIQLKDLYRRMKIHARKVYKQRSRELLPGETQLTADEPTERLMAMMFSVNSLQPTSYLDVDVKPMLDPSDFSNSELPLGLSEEEGANQDSGSQFGNGPQPNLIWTPGGEVRLPTDIVVTEMPVYASEPSEGGFSDGNLAPCLREDKEKRTVTEDVSSAILNRELLKMARKEHEIKMRVHEAALEVLSLQKRKLLRDLQVP